MKLPLHGALDSAKVRVVECGSYVCPFCRKSEATLAKLEERYAGLSVAWLHFPLMQDAARLAFAGVAAHRQGRFWDMHRELFQHAKPMNRDDVLRVAARLGLDVDRFERDLDDPTTELEVARQRHVCAAAGVIATPTFFINGDLVRGELGIDQLSVLVDDILAADAP